MILSLTDMHDLAATCAPTVAAETLLSITKVESRFNTLAIGVNGAPRVTVRAKSSAEAVRQASALIAVGRSVDLGLAQINSRNLGWLGLTVEAAFDPCHNLAAAARVLQDGYGRSGADAVGEQPALRTALSFYNTGNARRGFANGYVAKVEKAAAQLVPAIQAGPTPAPITARAASPPPAWDVFGQATVAGFVIRVSAPGDAP